MKVSFFDASHQAFYTETLEQAEREERRVGSKFKSLSYLCALYPETRTHFSRLFDWQGWYICYPKAGKPELLGESQGWPLTSGTATVRTLQRVTMSLPVFFWTRYLPANVRLTFLKKYAFIFRNTQIFPKHNKKQAKEHLLACFIIVRIYSMFKK